MEPLFINQYARDEAVIKEIYRSYYLTPISIMFYFCAGISFIANLIFLLLNHALYDTCAFFATIVCLLSPPLFYRCRFSIAIKQDKDRFGQPPLMTYEISGSGMIITNTTIQEAIVDTICVSKSKSSSHLNSIVCLPAGTSIARKI